MDKVWEERLRGVLGSQKGAAAVRLHFGDKSLLFITFDVEVVLLMDYCSQSEGEEEVESEDEDDVGVESLDYDTIHNVVHDTLLK